ncbi:MAG: hypothetical protein R6X18_17430 [Chloroflexota bacterium]
MYGQDSRQGSPLTIHRRLVAGCLALNDNGRMSDYRQDLVNARGRLFRQVQMQFGSLHTWVLLLTVIGISLSACSRIPDGPAPTVAATAVFLPTVAEAESSPAPPPTSTLPPPTATLLPTVTALSPPCEYPIQSELSEYWDGAELGCPAGAGQFPISTAYAPFEGGQMLWRGDTDTIYVLYNDGRWETYPNEWQQSIQEFTCGEENSPPTPIRGFGHVWCNHPAVREALGAVTALEIGDQASATQDFSNGTILVAPFGSLFVFNTESGQWRRIDVDP